MRYASQAIKSQNALQQCANERSGAECLSTSLRYRTELLKGTQSG